MANVLDLKFIKRRIEPGINEWYIEFVAKPSENLTPASFFDFKTTVEFKNHTSTVDSAIKSSPQLLKVKVPRFNDDMCKKCDIKQIIT